jgi:hypothetical protein
VHLPVEKKLNFAFEKLCVCGGEGRIMAKDEIQLQAYVNVARILQRVLKIVLQKSHPECSYIISD